MSRSLILLAGDQLSHELAALEHASDDDVIALCEVAEEGRYVPHHPQKIAMMLSAMRHFAASLRDKGYRVHYSALDDPDNAHSLLQEAERLAKLYDCQRIVTTRPGEWRLLQAIEERRSDVPWEWTEDTRFYCTPEAFAQWLSGRKQPRMEAFYREMRRHTGLLMEGDEPMGGQWNFDKDNRKPLDQRLDVPSPPEHGIDDTTQAVLDLVAEHFGDHFGDLDGFHWPVTRRQALVDLRHFIDALLPDFGDYQDAISDDDPYLFHSRLSAPMNLGLISPREVCEAAQNAYLEGKAPINAVEGFVRQILGWREYVRGVYWSQMPDYKRGNALKATRGLPRFYWTGETDMRCLQRAIGMTRENAYAHHIQRLMVTGNFALLCGVSPEALCDWYLAVYADACEWVELPNTLGMVLHADGGIMGSKPYCASGKYIDRMSDHCRDCRYDVKKTTGETACPFNSLYWHFLERHADTLSNNHRMKLIYGSLSRMSDDKRTAMREQAESFLATLELEPSYGQGEHVAGYRARGSSS
ncbi:cryptochrome/photolyase family protein [Halomonas sp. DP8Y7-3]|uniref:cryptochrome/photolyase family protein n=1 Tax=Halomonas sp. DP8Y7-3 TaxID=2859079 RepID=UPI001C94A1A1|nr:cryptochrome/photolyase family protein [Halomonas sp. DP8Y7-3]MBY5929648.1 cryptochrome/photolyase family protein [Halomonas sp. DP8Y7-3]